VAVWSVQPNFFKVLSIPIVKGRALLPDDPASVAVINESMARRAFTGHDPIGQEVPGARGIRIVGVARNARVNGARRGRNSQSLENVPAAYYVPDFTNAGGPIDIAIRTAGHPDAMVPAIMDTLRGVHPNLAPFVGTQDALMVRRSVGGGQFGNAAVIGVALGTFAALSLLLVAIGLYGVTSYSVAARSNEFGVRMALGAAPRSILLQVQREVLRLMVIGTAVGAATSIPIVLLFERTIFRAVQPDLLAPVLALLLMIGVAALAAYLPARRAAGFPPLVALRNE
jgi:ABC-type antimicrobial peptide transport system permease subunit